MEIKTLHKSISRHEEFDREINCLIKKGWNLTRRDVLRPTIDDEIIALYAELEREDEEDQIKLRPEVMEMVERCRGTSSVVDYINSALPLGIICMNKVKREVTDMVMDGAPAEEE